MISVPESASVPTMLPAYVMEAVKVSMMFPSAVLTDVVPVFVKVNVPLIAEGVVAYAGEIDASASIRPALEIKKADHFNLTAYLAMYILHGVRSYKCAPFFRTGS